jgi:hypothetical protein
MATTLLWLLGFAAGIAAWVAGVYLVLASVRALVTALAARNQAARELQAGLEAEVVVLAPAGPGRVRVDERIAA